MSVQEILLKIKSLTSGSPVYAILLGIAVAGASFGVGRLSGVDISPKPAVLLPTQSEAPATAIASVGEATSSTQNTGTTTAMQSATSPAKTGKYVASKKGKKYHLVTCPGAKTISDANKIWFQSKEEAEQNGYTRASNCKGI